MVKNYFKAGRDQFFFFADNDEDDTVRAYSAATELGTDIAVFAPPATRGPWDGCQVVGFRCLRDIAVDFIDPHTVAVELERLADEVRSLPSTTIASGGLS